MPPARRHEPGKPQFADDAFLATMHPCGPCTARYRMPCQRRNFIMDITAFAAVGTGAILGAWLRWGLSNLFDAQMTALPLGALVANMLGGLVMGASMALFAHPASPNQHFRLFLVIGFLGSLTTFSTFSAEAVGLLLRQQYGWFAGHVTLHVAGTLGMTLLGFGLIRMLWHV